MEIRNCQKNKKKPKYPVYLHELRHSTPNEFKATVQSIKTISESALPALEVLVTEHEAVKRLQPQIEIEDGISSVSKKPSPSNSVPPTSISSSPDMLRIRSRALINWLGIITDNDEFRIFANDTDKETAKSALVILRPFKILVTFETEIREQFQKLEKELDAMVENQEENHVQEKTDLLKDVRLLVTFLDIDLGPTFQLRRDIANGTATHISYGDLWHLFQYGSLVVNLQHYDHIYKVLKTTGGREPLVHEMPDYPPKPHTTYNDGFLVDCFNLNYNGISYKPVLIPFTIIKYDGLEKINSLPVYPTRFHEDYPLWEANILKNSEAFLRVTKPSYTHHMYSGRTMDDPPEEIDSQVIVDVDLAMNRNPHWINRYRYEDFDLSTPDLRETQMPIICDHKSIVEGCHGGDISHKDIAWDEQRNRKFLNNIRHKLQPREPESLDAEDRYLIPHGVHGFILRSRKWVTLHVNNLSPVKFESTFNNLVLPPGHQDTVKALVRNHSKVPNTTIEATSKVGAAMDLVQGKGKGLIILLHGEPGVGKTSTAECVADLTQRPLFPITCGDIGETAEEVQSNLESNFQMAHKWGSVLLLDEADVFLAKRDKKDLRRNAVVSVFLRTLEYYSGILFLTTNRVGSFDQAFKSRIHMSLFFPKLDMKATISLYEVLLKRTISEQEKSKVKEFKVRSEEIIEFAKKHYTYLGRQGLGTWNGRQIRNAFQTAIALVEYDARQPGTKKPSLGKKHSNRGEGL